MNNDEQVREVISSSECKGDDLVCTGSIKLHPESSSRQVPQTSNRGAGILPYSLWIAKEFQIRLLNRVQNTLLIKPRHHGKSAFMKQAKEFYEKFNSNKEDVT